MWMRSRSAEYRLFYRARLQKRPIISRSLLIVSSHSLLHELLSSTPSLTPVVSNTRVCLLPTLSRVCASYSLSHACMHVYFALLKAHRALLIVFRALLRVCFLPTLSRVCAPYALSHEFVRVCFALLKAHRALLTVFSALFGCVRL